MYVHFATYLQIHYFTARGGLKKMVKETNLAIPVLSEILKLF